MGEPLPLLLSRAVSITGITDLAIADGGTGASTASVARTNLGVAIGTDVQAYDAGLQSISGLTTTADQMIYTTSSDTYATTSLTSAGRALLDDADASAQRTTLGLGTIATQNANNVTITGGTISGISNISDPGTSLPYTFSTTTTDSDPGSGIVRLNNATQNAATEIYIDDEDNDGTNVSGVIALLAGGNNPSSVLGYVTIRKEFAPENFITMKITTLTSASGYTKLVGTVEASSGATPFSDTDNLYFSIDVSGDKGDPGDISGPGSSTDNAVVRWDGTSGSLVQNSGVIIDDSGNFGIGTTTIESFGGGHKTLEVSGSSTAHGGIFKTATSDSAGAGSAGTEMLMYTTSDGGTIAVTSTDSLFFHTSNTERMRIVSSGNVGIGTSSPSALLDVNGTTRLGGAVSLEDNEVTRSKLKDYSETTVIANTGATYTIDLENGNVFNLTLTGDCTYTFSNPPASGSAGAFTLIQNQDGTGSRTVTWPASVEWAGGSAPTITSTASSTDVFTFITTDGGTTWYGFTGGQDFS
jgi:hypothetical protein